MQQLSVIVVSQGGSIKSVRIHAELKDEDLGYEYVSHLSCEPGTLVEIWPIDLYTDIGDLTPGREPMRFEEGPLGWLKA